MKRVIILMQWCGPHRKLHGYIIKTMRGMTIKRSRCPPPIGMQRWWSQEDGADPRTLMSIHTWQSAGENLSKFKIGAVRHSEIPTASLRHALLQLSWKKISKYRLFSSSLSVSRWQHFFPRKLKKKKLNEEPFYSAWHKSYFRS